MPGEGMENEIKHHMNRSKDAERSCMTKISDVDGVQTKARVAEPRLVLSQGNRSRNVKKVVELR